MGEESPGPFPPVPVPDVDPMSCLRPASAGAPPRASDLRARAPPSARESVLEQLSGACFSAIRPPAGARPTARLRRAGKGRTGGLKRRAINGARADGAPWVGAGPAGARARRASGRAARGAAYRFGETGPTAPEPVGARCRRVHGASRRPDSRERMVRWICRPAPDRFGLCARLLPDDGRSLPV